MVTETFVICLTVVLILAIIVFLAYIFKHSDRNDFFSIISKTFQSMTKKKQVIAAYLPH